MKETNEFVTPEKLSALVAEARRGEQDAYTALYEATSQEVYRTARAMVRSEDQALDIQQDVYVHAFTHLDQLEEPSKFRVWLRSITVNCARSELRKQTPILISEIEPQDGAVVPELPDLRPGNAPELALEQKETAGYVREILDGLSPGQRMLVGMYYYEQIPASEIARELELSPGTVKTQLYRSRKKIEAAVKRLEDRGVKLCGLAPLPFLLALLKRQEPAAEASREVLQASLAQSGVVSETVAVHLGRRFFQTALGRVLLGLMTAAALGGGVAAWNWYQSRPMGDFQPPTTVDELMTASDEDLTEASTAPTEFVAPSDTEEDLTEPETTEPETTEPASEPTGPTDPVGTDDPISPSDPTEPTGPAETGPGSGGDIPGPTSPSEEPSDTTAPSEAPEPRFLRWYWLSDVNSEPMDLYDVLNPSTGSILYVEVQGNVAPTVSADVDGVIKLSEQIKLDSYDGIERYVWFVNYAGSGTVHLFCDFNGTRQGTVTIYNPEYPPAYLYSEWTFWRTDPSGEPLPDSKTITDKLIGNQDAIWVYVQNAGTPKVYTEDPSVLQISFVNNGPGDRYYETYTRWNVKVVGCGTAHVYVEVAGELVDSYTIQAPEYPKSVLRFQWLYENETNTYGVGGLNLIDMLIEGNEIPKVYTDDPAVVQLSTTSYSGGETGGRVRGYHITVKMIGAGTANIICEYEGKLAYVFPVTVLPAS